MPYTRLLALAPFGLLVLSFVNGCGAAADSGLVGDEPIDSTEEALPIGPLDPRPWPRPRVCELPNTCSLVPSHFSFNAALESDLRNLGCATPASTRPSTGLVERKVTRCPDTPALRQLVAQAATYAVRPKLVTSACASCLPPLQAGRVYVFYNGLYANPNCPNNCAQEMEGDGSTWEMESP
jgi:hypothetical protein